MARFFTHMRLGSPPAAASPAGSVFATAAAIPVQAKLTVGAPNDRYEREADQVASQVVGFLHAPAVNEPAPQGAVQRQISPAAGGAVDLVQECDCGGGTCDTAREEPEAAHSEDAGSRLQRASEGGAEPSPPSLGTIEARLQQARRGGGEPFAPTVRRPMEKAFGTDFSGVTIHRDRPAHELNHTLQARAFTTGQDIFFRKGEYNPASRRGQELIAHELTHVVQQSGGKVQRAQSAGGGVLQRACTRAECGPDAYSASEDVEMEDPDESDDDAIQVDAKPLDGRSGVTILQRARETTTPRTGHPFSGAAAVPVAAGHLVVQRAATVTGALDNTAARKKNLGAVAGAFADNYGGTATNNTATWMTADWLHRQAAGTGVGGRRPDHWNVFTDLADGLNPFCQGHFLSRKLGGKGAYDNLAPFTASLNQLHETRVESEVIDWTKKKTKKKGGQDEWAHYQVDANYNGNNDVETWALNKYNGMAAKDRKAAADNIPGKGPFKTAAAADPVATAWIKKYVKKTFLTDIDCKVKFIEDAGASYKTNTNWQTVNITNEF